MILLNVHGHPRPQPRPRLGRGRVVSTLSPLARRWIAQVEAAARQAAREHDKPAGPLFVTLDFRLPTPKKARHGLPHTFVPDADNLAKLVLDSIMRAGLIGDDSAVSCLLVRKSWASPSHAGVGVTISKHLKLPDSLTEPPRPDWVGGQGVAG